MYPANLPKGAYFKNYLRDGVCFKRNNGGGLFLGVTRHWNWRQGWSRHCHWRQRWREAGIVTGIGDIGHVGGRKDSVANGNGDTPPAGAAIRTGGIVHVGLAHKAGETAWVSLGLAHRTGETPPPHSSFLFSFWRDKAVILSARALLGHVILSVLGHC